MSDVLLAGGRVIDPETGRDEVCDVLVRGDRVAEVGPGVAAPGVPVVDVACLVVAPGFIDLHSHAEGVIGQRLQACDGVTTALELEAGATPVELAYRLAADEGRPLNYGFSASWALARMATLMGSEPDGRISTFLHQIGDPRWQPSASPVQLRAVLDLLSADLAAGALGIGILVGYAQEIDPAEYLAVAGLAAAAGVPTFTHARDLVEERPGVPVDGAEEIVRAAGETGCAMHYCHVNSTSRRHVERVTALVDRARSAGSVISVEAYPYGAGMTGIGATFLDPDALATMGLRPDSLLYAPTGERVADAARLRQLRAEDPGGLAIIEFLEEDDPLLRQTLLQPGVIVASDAMPITFRVPPTDPMAWPVPAGGFTHPRSAGTFSRALRRLTREDPALGLSDVLARCSLFPARVLEAVVPGMRRKGRVQQGCDADLVVFDPATVTDQATYTDSTRPSTGFRHVLVNGEFVLRDAAVVPGALPGRAVRG